MLCTAKHSFLRLLLGVVVAVFIGIDAAPALAAGPSAPTGVSASPASSQAQVSWTAPSNNGGSAISSYTITPYIGTSAQTSATVNDGSAASAVVTGLTNGTAYTFTVTANNASGPGTASQASNAVTPEDTIFDFGGTPSTVDSGDSHSIELGIEFTASTPGSITGVRFYKAATNTGTHTGSLWTATGQLLATGTFGGETSSGWQTLVFSSPVSISAGSTYVASYFAPNGHYSATVGGLNSAVTNGPLTAPASGTTANGVFSYSATSTFPTGTYNANNYWVDVLFAPASGGGGGSTTPGAPTGVSASPAGSQAQVSWTPPSNNGGSAITSYTITPYIGSSAQSTTTVNNGAATSAVVTGLTNGTAYTFTVTASNTNGPGTASSASGAVTPEDTIFDFGGTPATVDSGDSHSIELGVEFTPSTSGTITGVRFYKAATNTGTHTGSLWSAGGQQLATGTFGGESASGWQTLVFSSPVTISAGSTYVASYFAPNGHYSATAGGLNSAVTNGPLTAPATGTSANGLYSYSSSSVFPTSTFSGNNYWVDVLFAPGSGGGGGSTTPGAPTGVSASPAGSEAQVSWTPPSSNGGSAITSYTITPYVGTSAQATSTVNNGSATSAIVTGLTNGTTYTFTVIANNKNGPGTASGASGAVTPEDTIFDFGGTPGIVDSGDTHPIDLGVEFTPTSNGLITGVRFYKTATNTGTHTGDLWTTGGQQLATGTFTGETTSGWQTLVFSSPVSVTAGTTYVASYFAPNGHYSATASGFSSAVTNGPLTAPANSTVANGLFSYSAANAFPTSSYNANDYWVDVLFQPVTGSGAPGQPTNVNATAQPDGATVSWSPSLTGGLATSYTVTPYTGTTAWPPTTVSGGSTANLTGLIPDEQYTFIVQGSNSSGTGPASAPSNAITPLSASVPSAPQSVSASPASNQALVSWTAPSNDGGSSITGYTITPYIGSTAQTPLTVNNGSATSAVVSGLTDGTAYTFNVAAINGAGTGAASNASSAVTPEFTIFDFGGTPTIIDSGDSQSAELGVKFTADSNGTILGIRFYKAAANTGTHVGNLWTAGGQQLATGTFTNESASGWQTLVFTSPVSITAGTTYIASYFDPQGHYSATSGGLTASYDNAPLHAISNGTSANGVYSYTTTNSFPTSTFNANNYWVDVLYSPSSTNSAPGAPSNVSANAGFGTATINWTAPWNGGSPITSYTITPYIGSTAQTATTINGSPPVTDATLTNLTNGTAYTFTVTATNANGTSAPSTASAPVTPGPQPQGQWSPLQNWPLVAIHSSLAYTGKLVVWDGWQQPEPTQEFDPSTGTFTDPINSPDGLFCSAMVQMPDGRILVVGGYGELSTGNLGIVDTNIYDPATGTWSRVANMASPRWYPGLTELSDGTDVVISGKTSDFSSWADTPEVYDPATNAWTPLSNVNTSQIHELEYPNTYLLPNGNVFVYGPAEDKSFELNVAGQTWTQVGGASGVVNGGSVMYRPGKVLAAGGAASLASPSTAQSNAATIDLTAASPQWTTISPMHFARAFNTATMLADGSVLMIGGEPQTAVSGGQGEVQGGVLPAEIWDPSTGQWTTVASMAATRGYHTSTMLLPSGQVLVAGSGHAAPGDPGQYNAQIYSPSYLFKGARPTITSIPSSATYNSNITISTPDASSISAVNLVDLGTSTHQMDFSQHFVPLSFTAGSGSLSVTTPANGNYAPPGYYMVFVVNSQGVPSVASIIKITAPAGGAKDAGAGGIPAARHASAATHLTLTVTGSSTAKSTSSPRPGTRTVKPIKPATSPTKRSSHLAPAFVQKTTGYQDTTDRLPLIPSAPLHARDRLVVEASIWGSTAQSVTDSAGERFTELLRHRAADGTEISVWTAPVTTGAGSRPTITISPTSPADVGAVALEYSGLSTAPGNAAVDQIALATGVSRGRTVVGSGHTHATTAPGELAVGLYSDSGFGDILRSGHGFHQRANISPTTTMMEQLVEDQLVGAGATPSATVRTGADTPWSIATVVFKPAGATLSGSGASVHSLLEAYSAQPATAPTPAVPLSRRHRPHIVAGGIAEFVGWFHGKRVHYYCLTDPSGHPEEGLRVRAGTAGASWMPAGLPQVDATSTV